MFYSKKFVVFGLMIGLLALGATAAKADSLDYGNATVTCSTYQLATQASGLPIGETYVIKGTIVATPSTGTAITENVTYTFVAAGLYEDYTFSGSFSPALSGTYTFSGTAGLYNSSGDLFNTRTISFSPTSLTCSAPPPPPCSANSSSASNFNGTPVPAGDYVWFNSNFKASGIPSTGVTITFTNASITFGEGSTPYNLFVPNAQITFSPSATCSSTTFNSATNTWVTMVPVKGDDEIFLTGLAWQIPSGGLPGGINPVTFNGTFNVTTDVPGITVQWVWSAAAYSSFTTNYNQLAIKPGHQTACGASNGDHAGTPEGVNNSNQPWKQFVVGGTRGGGGSNWTGSWSGTDSVTPLCSTNGGGGQPM